jgi:hypothetical protein
MGRKSLVSMAIAGIDLETSHVVTDMSNCSLPISFFSSFSSCSSGRVTKNKHRIFVATRLLVANSWYRSTIMPASIQLWCCVFALLGYSNALSNALPRDTASCNTWLLSSELSHDRSRKWLFLAFMKSWLGCQPTWLNLAHSLTY